MNVCGFFCFYPSMPEPVQGVRYSADEPPANQKLVDSAIYHGLNLEGPFCRHHLGPVGTTKLFETLSRKFWKPTASTGRSRSGSHGKPQDSDGPEFKGRAERGYPEASSSGVSVQLKIFFELLSNSSQRIITLCLTRFPIFVKSLLLAPARRLGATPLSRDVTKYVCDRSRPPFNSGRVAPRTSLRRSSYAGVIRLAL